MSLFSVMNVANRGLQASQLGLDVTSQNIANADTEGYSRKRLTLAADYRYDGLYGQMGLGVDVVNIARVRDSTIDQQIVRQNHQFGYFNRMDDTLEALENILNEPSDTGIIGYMDEFFDSWNNLANNPSDLAARTMVKTAGQTLTDVFHNTANELEKLKLSQNNNVAATVDEINKIAREIFNLNKEIAGIELSDQNANDSRDRRDLLMKDLAELVDYDVFEDDAGQVTVTIGGNIFLSAVTFNEVELTSTTETQADAGYLKYGISMKGMRSDLVINGGELKGLMDARDITIPKYEKTLDEFAIAITLTINEQHRQGYNLNGYTGFNFFDPSLTGARDFGVAASVLSNVSNIAAAEGGTQVTASTNVIAAGDLNFGNQPLQLSKTLGTNWVTGDPDTEKANNIINGTLTMKIAASGTVLTEGTDFAVNYIDGTIQMLHNGFDNVEMNIDFNYTNGNFSGPGNNANAIEIAKLRETLTMNPNYQGDFTSTFADFYSGMIGDVGLERTEAISNKETREYLIQQYHDSQEAIAGVSLDEEMANLIKYQHTYQGAAKIIATAQQMLDILMNI